MAEGMKPCPKCGKDVQAAAVLCRHCGERFDGAAAAPPPKKKGMATCLVVGLVVGVGGILVLGILAALLLPAIARATRMARVTSCANNLSQLWRMQNVYMSQFGGRMKSMPDKTGAEFWLELNRTQPPLVDDFSLEIYLCPLRDDHDRCDYLGPAVPVSRLPGGDPVGADRPGNHGDDGGNLLRKSGDVIELKGREFTNAAETLKP
jgi:hypothetical protein